MGLSYHSPRPTVNIDLTAALGSEVTVMIGSDKPFEETFSHAATVPSCADLIVGLIQ